MTWLEAQYRTSRKRQSRNFKLPRIDFPHNWAVQALQLSTSSPNLERMSFMGQGHSIFGTASYKAYRPRLTVAWDNHLLSIGNNMLSLWAGQLRRTGLGSSARLNTVTRTELCWLERETTPAVPLDEVLRLRH